MQRLWKQQTSARVSGMKETRQRFQGRTLMKGLLVTLTALLLLIASRGHPTKAQSILNRPQVDPQAYSDNVGFTSDSGKMAFIGVNSADHAFALLAGNDEVLHQHAGVYGESDQQGVFGNSTSDTGIGIYGRAQGQHGVAGRFVGDVQVTGTLTAPAITDLTTRVAAVEQSTSAIGTLQQQVATLQQQVANLQTANLHGGVGLQTRVQVRRASMSRISILEVASPLLSPAQDFSRRVQSIFAWSILTIPRFPIGMTSLPTRVACLMPS